MKAYKKAFVWLAVIVAAGVLTYFLAFKKTTGAPAETAGSEAAEAAGQEIMPIQVRVVPARKGEVIIGLKSPGEAYTERSVLIKAEVGGVIQKLTATEGRHVAKDEVLVEVDDREYRLKLHKLEALRLKALSEVLLEKMFAGPDSSPDPALLERLEKLRIAFEEADARHNKGLASEEEWQKARREYELALIESGGKKEEIMASTKNLTQTEVDVRLAELDLERARIRAPFAGIVTDIKISPGENISTGQELFTLVDISAIKVRAGVLESEVGKMKAGREVDIRFPAYPGRIFKGTIQAVSPVVNPEDRTCAVYIGILNLSEEIKPGMHAEVEIAAEVYPDRLIVPQEAILVRAGRKLVFVVEDNLAKWRYVQTGVENETFAEILEGLKEGEMVITEGHFTLAHDARVSVVKE